MTRVDRSYFMSSVTIRLLVVSPDSSSSVVEMTQILGNDETSQPPSTLQTTYTTGEQEKRGQEGVLHLGRTKK